MQIMRHCGKEILPYFKFIFQIISIDIDKYQVFFSSMDFYFTIVLKVRTSTSQETERVGLVER